MTSSQETSGAKRAKYLQGVIVWADKWLATPVDQLPGTLTHDAVREDRDRAQSEIWDLQIMHGGYTADGRFAGYVR